MRLTDNKQMHMREWLSGGAPPCQGGGRGFDPRLALFFIFMEFGAEHNIKTKTQ